MVKLENLRSRFDFPWQWHWGENRMLSNRRGRISFANPLVKLYTISSDWYVDAQSNVNSILLNLGLSKISFISGWLSAWRICLFVKNEVFTACSHRFIANAFCAFFTWGFVRCRYCNITPCTVISAKLCGCFDVSAP